MFCYVRIHHCYHISAFLVILTNIFIYKKKLSRPSENRGLEWCVRGRQTAEDWSSNYIFPLCLQPTKTHTCRGRHHGNHVSRWLRQPQRKAKQTAVRKIPGRRFVVLKSLSNTADDIPKVMSRQCKLLQQPPHLPRKRFSQAHHSEDLQVRVRGGGGREKGKECVWGRWVCVCVREMWV